MASAAVNVGPKRGKLFLQLVETGEASILPLKRRNGKFERIELSEAEVVLTGTGRGEGLDRAAHLRGSEHGLEPARTDQILSQAIAD